MCKERPWLTTGDTQIDLFESWGGYCFDFGDENPTNVYMHTYTYTRVPTDTVMLHMGFCLLNKLVLVCAVALKWVRIFMGMLKECGLDPVTFL